MTREASNYLIRETVVSILIGIVPAWGPHGLVMDTLPQTFVMTAMCVLAPSLLTHKRHGQGLCKDLVVLPGHMVAGSPTRIGILFRALVFAIGAVVIGVAATATMLVLAFPGGIPFAILMFYRAVYGAVVGLCVTPIAITFVLHEGHVLAYAKAQLTQRGTAPGPAGL
jgi:hypothetical protein